MVWGTFGKDPSCVINFLEKFHDRPHLLQIHFSNETCRRDRSCLEGEIANGATVYWYNRYLAENPQPIYREVLDRIQEIRAFVDEHKNSNTALLLSLGLEDNYTAQAARNLEALLRPSWPYLINRNPVRNDAIVTNKFLEAHDPRKALRGPWCIFSEDGNRSSLTALKSRLKAYRHCIVVFAWRRNWQNAEPRERRFVPPRSRKFYFTAKDRRDVRYLLRRAP